MRNLLMFVVALSLSSFALAQNHLYLGAKAGYMNWDDDRFADSDDEDGGNVGGQIGYQFNSSTALELAASTDLSGPETEFYELALLNRFGGNDKLRPYWLAGVAFFDSDEENSIEEVTSGLVGIGISNFLSDRVELRGDVRGYYSFDSDAETGLFDFGANVALNYHFGDQAAPAPRRAAAPAPAPAPARRAAPAPAPIAAQVDEMRTITVQLNVEFETNKADVAAVYGDEIQEIADAMRAQPSIELVLEGHTDSAGSDVYNQGLSQRRVEAVKQILVSDYGISANRVSAIGYGESRPIADNATAEGRARNRRVVGVMSWEEKVQ